MPLTALGDQPLRFRLYFPRQYLSAILRYPDQVIGNRIVGIPGFPHLQDFLIHVRIIAYDNHACI